MERKPDESRKQDAPKPEHDQRLAWERPVMRRLGAEEHVWGHKPQSG